MPEYTKRILEVRRSVQRLSSKNLELFLESIGWTVIWSDTTKGKTLLSNFEMSDQGKRAFSFEASGERCVAIQRQHPEKDLCFLLLHEIGHILLEHNLCYLSVDDENEANLFAERCLRSYRISAFGKHAVVVIIIMVAALILSGRNTLAAVYVTPHGEKYHVATCRYVKGKAELLQMTIADAKRKGLEHCTVCIE